jgi:hypothetical protein
MQNLPLVLAALACPVGMGMMMFFMMRPGAQRGEQSGDGQRDQEITQLREQVVRLRAEQEGRLDSERWAP